MHYLLHKLDAVGYRFGLWDHSSAGEHSPHTRGVASSILAGPTNLTKSYNLTMIKVWENSSRFFIWGKFGDSKFQYRISKYLQRLKDRGPTRVKGRASIYVHCKNYSLNNYQRISITYTNLRILNLAINSIRCLEITDCCFSIWGKFGGFIKHNVKIKCLLFIRQGFKKQKPEWDARAFKISKV